MVYPSRGLFSKTRGIVHGVSMKGTLSATSFKGGDVLLYILLKSCKMSAMIVNVSVQACKSVFFSLSLRVCNFIFR